MAVTVQDLARRRVPVPAQFRIPRSQIVWTDARMARRRGQMVRNVILSRPVGNDWSVDAGELVLVMDPDGDNRWVAYDGARVPAARADHDAHMRCGGDILWDKVHALRHAKRNPACIDCAAIVVDAKRAGEAEAAAAAKAEASIAPVALEGPDAAEVLACGHDGKTLALLIAKAKANPHGDSVKIADKRYTLLGRGVSRVAVDLGCEKHVLKVEYNRAGGGQFNHQGKPECEAFMRLTPEQRNDVARIFAWTPDYAGVVFEKAYKNAEDLVRALKQRASRLGFGDLHANNLGFRANGQPIVLDYGL